MKKFILFIIIMLLCCALSSTVMTANALTITKDTIQDYEIKYFTYKYDSAGKLPSYLLNEKNSKDDLNILMLSYGAKFNTIKEVYDFNDNATFAVLEYTPIGYAIFNRNTGTILERSPYAKSPYTKYMNKKLFYGGPSNYFYEKNNQIINIANNLEINKETKKILSQQLKLVIKEDKQSANFKSRNAIKKYVNTELSSQLITTKDYKENIELWCYDWECLYFMLLSSYYCANNLVSVNGYSDLIFGNNSGALSNSCSQVATGMLLQYYDRNNHYDIVPDGEGNYPYEQNDPNGYNHNLFGDGYIDYSAICLQRYLIYLTHNSYTPGATTTPEMVNGLEDYLDIMGYSSFTSISSTTSSIAGFIKSNIDNGNLCVLTTILNVAEYYNNDTSNLVSIDASLHTVLVYGYTYNDSGNLDEYVCHFGWREDEENGTNYACCFLNKIWNQGAFTLLFDN